MTYGHKQDHFLHSHGHALQLWFTLYPFCGSCYRIAPSFSKLLNQPWLAAEFNGELTYRTLNPYRYISCVTPKQAQAQLALLCSVEAIHATLAPNAKQAACSGGTRTMSFTDSGIYEHGRNSVLYVCRCAV